MSEIDLELMYEKDTGKEFHRSLPSEYREWLEKKLTEVLTIPVVSHSKNLTLLEAIENTKQLPQVQYDLQRQLRELRVMANKLGLYDAADFIKPYCD
jgi:hypothetical protein